MSATPTKTASVQNSVAPEIAVERKSIQMKHFRDPQSITECVMKQQAIALGMVVGAAFAVKLRQGTLPDGTKNESYLTIGDFEATNYKTGEVFTSTGIYLPRYFAETIEAAVNASPGGVSFGIEIVVEPTGKQIGEGIQYSYGVKRLMARKADSAVEQIKRELQARKLLRGLPPPAAKPDGSDPLTIDYEAASPAAGRGGAVDAAMTDAGVDETETETVSTKGPRPARQRGGETQAAA
jgi:hypothetical protein